MLKDSANLNKLTTKKSKLIGQEKVEFQQSLIQESSLLLKESYITDISFDTSNVLVQKLADIQSSILKNSNFTFDSQVTIQKTSIEQSKIIFKELSLIQDYSLTSSSIEFIKNADIRNSKWEKSNFIFRSNATIQGSVSQDPKVQSFGKLDIQSSTCFNSYFTFDKLLSVQNLTGKNINFNYNSLNIQCTVCQNSNLNLKDQLSLGNQEILQESSTIQIQTKNSNLILNGQVNYQNFESENSNIIYSSPTSLQNFYGKDSTFEINQQTSIQNSVLENSMIKSQGKMTIQNMNTKDSLIEINNDVTFIDSSECIFFNTSIINQKGSTWKQTGNIKSSSSILQNQGIIILNSTKDIQMEIDLFNDNELHIIGLNTVSLSVYKETFDSYLFLNNSRAKFNQPLVIENGTCLLSGSIETDHFYYSSSRSLFRLAYPYTLFINGNCTFGEKSTVFLKLNGLEFEKNNNIEVNGTLTINSFLYLRAVNFKPEIETRIGLFKYQKLIINEQNLNIYLSGLIYRSAKIDPSLYLLYLKVIYSFGSVVQKGYKCSYMGKKKVLEINHYKSQEKATIVLTFPKRNNVRYGFGVNTFNSTYLLALTNDDNTQAIQIMDHLNTSTSLQIFDIQVFESQSIFQIGPTYITFVLFVDSKFLKNQDKIIYAEFPMNGNGTSLNNTLQKHYYEVFDHKILSPEFRDCTNFLQPSRAEIYNIPTTSIILGFYLLVLILTIIFKNQRPLNSRGIDPFFTIAFISVQLLLEIRNHFEITEDQGSLCFFLAFGTYPLQVVCYFVNFFYFLRYFAIISLSETKKTIYELLKKNPELIKLHNTKTRIFKFFSKPIVTVALVLGSYFILLGLFGIIIAAYEGVCKFQTLVVLFSVQYIIMIIIYLFTLLTFLVDFIINFKKIFFKCGFYTYIFKSDPHLFRVQGLLYCPFMIYSLITGVYLLSTSTQFIDIIKYHESSMHLNTISCALLMCIDVLFPLTLAIIFLIIGCFEKKTKNNLTLEDILEDKILFDKFKTFCEDEATAENLLCYMEIISYQKTMNPNAIEIYTRYFNGDNSGALEVNVSRSECLVIFKQIKQLNIQKDLFDNIIHSVRRNIYDNSLLSFKKSSVYLDYLGEKNKQIELIEGKK